MVVTSAVTLAVVAIAGTPLVPFDCGRIGQKAMSCLHVTSEGGWLHVACSSAAARRQFS